MFNDDDDNNIYNINSIMTTAVYICLFVCDVHKIMFNYYQGFFLFLLFFQCEKGGLLLCVKYFHLIIMNYSKCHKTKRKKMFFFNKTLNKCIVQNCRTIDAQRG